MSRLILITGGARSGKSDFAEELARELGGNEVVFVATAQAGDDDMAQRIAAHRQSRPASWQTIESPRKVGEAIQQSEKAAVFLVDCLTLLVSNVLFSLGEDPDAPTVQAAVEEETRALIAAAGQTNATTIVVTNEVGLGIVPANRLARLYRDLLGRANAALAREAQEVYLLVSGLAVEIKSSALKRREP